MIAINIKDVPNNCGLCPISYYDDDCCHQFCAILGKEIIKTDKKLRGCPIKGKVKKLMSLEVSRSDMSIWRRFLKKGIGVIDLCADCPNFHGNCRHWRKPDQRPRKHCYRKTILEASK